MPEVTRSIEIQAPPSAVWRWLSSPEALRRWLSPTLEIDLRVGGRYRLLGPDEETRISGTVLELVPEGRLVLSWLEEGADWTYPARLVICLTATGAGTAVTLTHDGFAGIGKPGWPDTVKAYERGADRHRVLEQLAELARQTACTA
ncbi:MAG TPA: SRPBCC domain-containing protein [Streptosporangiaceae bacterium]|nr:SRPBCC domain-containing protein [Streptosporangiaceae bacterium]